jgi:hypothetical protein
MIAHDDDGVIIFSACRDNSFFYRDALGAELHAIMEGLSLALQWCNLPLVVETDCLDIIKLLHDGGVNRSVHASLIEENKVLLKERQTCVTHITVDRNKYSHYLANYARVNSSTIVNTRKLLKQRCAL